jgi:hypothetical protein
MPFQGELAGKTGHEDLLQNPEIEAFLGLHKDVPRPDEATMADVFSNAPRASAFTGNVPQLITAIDGSYYEASADQREPSRRVGYIKVGMVALRMDEYLKLGAGSSYVDPMAVNRLLDSNALSMALPGANLKLPQFTSTGEGYRFFVQDYYDGGRTKIRGWNDSLLDTLVCLLTYKGDVQEQNGKDCVKVAGCPDAECPSNQDGAVRKTFWVPIDEKRTTCDECGGMVFIIDAVRIGEAFVDSGSNGETYGRTMLASEHLILAHCIRYIGDNHLGLSGQFGFVMDGPLAVAGESAKLHAPIMMLIHDVNAKLLSGGFEPLLVMGLTKSGVAVDHFASLNWPAPGDDGADDLCDFAFPITDEYRYKYINPRPRTTDRPFGSETYYGQDILVRTKRGHEFVITLPYPTKTKGDPNFLADRYDLTKYVSAGKAFELIRTLESDLYSNALVPVILAHEYASISLVPGGKVLDLATARAVGVKN